MPVQMFLFIALITAGGGALLLWHATSRTKQVSEGLLTRYAEMLAAARTERARKLAVEEAPKAEEP